MYYIILIFLSLCTFSNIFSEGFAQDTLVKTKYGYKAIERIRRGEKIACYNNKKKKRRVCKVEEVYRSRVPYVIRLFFSQYDVNCAPDQKMYIDALREWRSIEDIVKNRYLYELFSKQTGLVHCAYVYEPQDVYIFTSKKYHNFFITRSNLLAHNFEPMFSSSLLMTPLSIPFVCEGGATALASGNVVAAGLIILVGGVCYCVDRYILKTSKKNKAKQIKKELEKERQRQLALERKYAGGGFGGPQKPPNDDEKNKQKKETPLERKERLRNYDVEIHKGRIESKKIAKERKWKIIDNPKFNPHNEEVYQITKNNSDLCVSYDNTRHKGGFWKLYRGKQRLGTYDKYLQYKVGD